MCTVSVPVIRVISVLFLIFVSVAVALRVFSEFRLLRVIFDKF